MRTLKMLGYLVALTALIVFYGCSTLTSPTESKTEETSNHAPDLNMIVLYPDYPLGGDGNSGAASGPTETYYGEQTYKIGNPSSKPVNIDHVAKFITSGRDIVPTDANAKYWTITVEAEKWDACPDFPDGALFFSCGPSGTSFSPMGTLELYWEKLNLPNGAIIKLYHFDTGSETWHMESISTDTSDPLISWDNSGKTVTLSIPHFSVWAISKD